MSFVESIPVVGQLYRSVLGFIRYLNYPTWIWLMIAVYLTLPFVTYVLLPKLYGNISTKRRVIIFVLGDLGHSPRMCYHARSFARKGYDVDLCGYLEEAPPIDLIDNLNVNIHEIKVIQNSYNLPFLIFGILKVVGQIFNISSLLWDLRGANYILLQNPPSIPTLAIGTLYKFVTRTKLIIDWHNLGYSILEIKLGPKHPFVSLAKIYEKFFAIFADKSLTVTKAMKKYLIKQCGVSGKQIVVLHDKAASQFQPLTPIEKANIIKTHPEIFKDFDLENDKIIASSTSFTPDEDFNILINALQKYDKQPNLPKLKVIITGKGPMKSQFLQSVQDSNFQKVNVINAWLSAEDYPKIIATADIGISLHTSSSGIDLPMKVVDMFGCGVPVIALDFPALPELVTNEVNGLTVNNSTELFENLEKLFTNDELYSKVKTGAIIQSKERWESNWSKFGDLLP